MSRPLISNILKSTLALLIGVFFTNQIFSQSADFSSNKTEGCTPLVVDFSVNNTSGITSYNWQIFYSDGTPYTSGTDNANQTFSFTDVGSYNVVLTVNGTITETKNNYITVHEKPVANFTVSTDTACVPATINFSDASTASGYSLNSWTWDFDNGNTGSGANENNTYNTPGTYDVLLTAGNSGLDNCVSSTSIPITILNQPNANFTASPKVACEPPLDVTFVNTSTDGFQYIWDTGLNTSTENDLSDVNETYTSYGTYDVVLTVTGFDGTCFDTFSDQVVIADVIADITSPSLGCVDASLGFNALGSQQGDTYTWDFGDGSGTSSGATTSHSFNAPGTYTVALTVTNAAAGCFDVTTTSVFIEDVVADFSVDETYFCAAPGVATFQDLSSTDGNSINSWAWDFGNGTGNSQNPVNNYSSEGVYDVSLTVTSDNGCEATVVYPQLITVSLPKVDITAANPPKGCEALLVDFPQVTTEDIDGTIVSWEWDFGDGNTQTINTPNVDPSNTYLDHGDYTACVTVTNDRGCDAIDCQDVEVGAKPIAGFYVTPTVSCARDDVNFFDTSLFEDSSLDPSLLDEWIWSGSGGFGSSIQNPVHQYDKVDAVGYNTAQLIVGYNGCYDTLEVQDVDSILGPIIENLTIISTIDCEDPYARTFTALFADTTSYIWVIENSSGVIDTLYHNGQGGPVDQSFFVSNIGGTIGGRYDTIQYTFPSGVSDDYTVSIVSWNAVVAGFDPDSCEYSQSVDVPIREIQAAMELSTDTICRLDGINFDGVTSSRDPVSWKWDFGDGVSTGFGSGALSMTNTTGSFPFPIHIYDQEGNYGVELIVKDFFGCTDTILDSVYVFQPVAGFTSDTTYGCFPFDVNFTDTSESLLPIVDWSWETPSTTASGVLPTFASTFNLVGINVVTVTIVDSLGCSDQTTRSVEVIRPTASFTIVDNTLCQYAEAAFLNSSAPYSGAYPIVSYDWMFGDDSTSIATNPLHTYADTGMMTIALTVTDALGCTNSTVKTDGLHVQPLPQIGFVADQTYLTCYNPAPAVTFMDTSISSYIVDSTYVWTLGNGANIDPNDTVQATYTAPGTYDVSLALTTTYGCSVDTTYENYITVDGPFALFSVTPTTVCLNTPITFTIDTMNTLVDHWEWVFNDGTKIEGQSQVNYAYGSLPSNGNNYYPASLVLYNADESCVVDTSQRITLIEVEADFLMNGLPNDTLYSCPPFPVDFTDASTDAQTWDWSLSQGETSTSQDPQDMMYIQEGWNEIVLSIEGGLSGCEDTVAKYIFIYPEPKISIMSDTTICANDEFQLDGNASSGLDLDWTPGLGLSDSTIINPTVGPNISTSYVLTATDITYGCVKVDSIQVDVIPVPVLDYSDSLSYSQSGDKNKIIKGDTVDIKILTDPGFNAVFSPTKGLTCSECLETQFYGIESTTYMVEIQDTAGQCAVWTLEIPLVLNDSCTADLPDAFTPNGDGQNDSVLVKGWGIKELISFDIYNRWGEKVYENPGDILHGWDGNFKGKPQNMDTYLMVARVELLCGEIRTFKKQLALYR